MPERRAPVIETAYEFAQKLWGMDITAPEGLMILGMAMGIFLESVEGSHRDMIPLADALHETAQRTFDQMRGGRDRGDFGNA